MGKIQAGDVINNEVSKISKVIALFQFSKYFSKHLSLSCSHNHIYTVAKSATNPLIPIYVEYVEDKRSVAGYS